LIAAEPRFIACRAAFPDARIVLFGIPFEGRVNLRRGADHGPRDLRVASDSIETYSPFLGRDLEDLAIADLGDCQLGDGTPREQLTRAREEIRGFWRPGLIPVMLGALLLGRWRRLGDHGIQVPVMVLLSLLTVQGTDTEFTYLTIVDSLGATQSIQLHTSCSAPLAEGDRVAVQRRE